MELKNRIVCLGWGSLVWDPRELPILGLWQMDGPKLPVEFTRQSKDGRMTLVVTADVAELPTLWVHLNVHTLDEAKEELRKREDILPKYLARDIGYWSSESASSHEHASAIGAWATDKGFEAVVWTALGPKFGGVNGRIPTQDEVLAYLRNRKGEQEEIAKRYVVRAPSQISTRYRAAIERELGWKPSPSGTPVRGTKTRDAGMYVIDRTTVLKKAYALLCIFFANKEIARRSDPDDPANSLTALERRFFVAEASRLLLEIAVALRVIDDQMKKMPKESQERKSYEAQRSEVDGYEYALFDDLGLNLRETCNKIIHSDVMEPHSSVGIEAHELDVAHRHGDGERTINWEHVNGYVRLAGTKARQEWYVLLDVEVLVRAVQRLLSPP